MRWVTPIGPNFGELRMRRWFAMLPVKIGRETRWMEYVTVLQEYGKKNDWTTCWHNRKFVEPGNKS